MLIERNAPLIASNRYVLEGENKVFTGPRSRRLGQLGICRRGPFSMPDTISIYDTTVRPFFFLLTTIADRSSILQIRRPTTVVVNGVAPFVPLFLEQVRDGSTRKEVASRVQGRHLSLQAQPRGRKCAKKKGRKTGEKIPRLQPESWRLAENETK